jgi:hypothetical protein
MSAPLNSSFFAALAEEAADRGDVNPRLAAALDAMRLGFAVLPLCFPLDGRGCSCGNAECPTPAKHPDGDLAKRGVHKASRSDNAIRFWWSREPRANVGIACDRMAVLDIDPGNGGDKELEALEAEHGDLPQTPCCLSGGGGTHRFFRLPEGMTSFDIAPGLEVKAGGGS